MSENTRLLIVDDSALYRQTITNVLRNTPNVTIVGIARNGREAIDKIAELDPDLLTLDVQMPDVDGITVLREINERGLRPRAVMVSSLTSEGAQITTDALLEGAFDFILKPTGSDPQANLQRLQTELEQKISAFREGHRWRAARARPQRPDPPTIEVESSVALAERRACRAVIIGTSTGGPAALKYILPRLPNDLPVPVIVVQHMPPRYTSSLASRLNESCPMPVAEAADGATLAPGTVTIARGGQQMKLFTKNGATRVRVTDDPPEHGCRPSVDYLLRSAIDVFDGQALAVILTGMGRDGCEACGQLKQRGGTVFAQHQDGCTVYGMPKAVVEAKLADRVVSLENMSRMIVRHVRRPRA
ncbi:MAG: protein-glutamate methylesterase/protein-glutamine glutaminase [Planctomycetota bacterium]|jgi:two-component system chemotaxis response regulator CheB